MQVKRGGLANISQGGTSEIVDLPKGLKEYVDIVIDKIDIPYFCADFLFDGEEYWFSEVELDGGIPIDVDRSLRILKDRFLTYLERHRVHILKNQGSPIKK